MRIGGRDADEEFVTEYFEDVSGREDRRKSGVRSASIPVRSHRLFGRLPYLVLQLPWECSFGEVDDTPFGPASRIRVSRLFTMLRIQEIQDDLPWSSRFLLMEPLPLKASGGSSQ